jgi:hypothetical protein
LSRLGQLSNGGIRPAQPKRSDRGPTARAQRWTPPLESVDRPLRHVLHESGGTLGHVYFPYHLSPGRYGNGALAEIAVVRNEDIVGVSLLMGGEPTPSRARVQNAGHGFRLKAHINEGGIQSRYSICPCTTPRRSLRRWLEPPRATAASHPRSTAFPLAPLELGPSRGQPAGDDSGTDRQHAGGGGAANGRLNFSAQD